MPRIWVGGINPNLTDCIPDMQEIGFWFVDNYYGRVTDVWIKRPKDGSAPYCFVDFLKEEFNEKVFTDEIVMDGGYHVTVRKAVFNQHSSLCLFGIPYGTTEEEIEAIFEGYDVDEIRMIQEDNKRPWSAVTLTNKSDLKDFIGKPCQIRGEDVSVRLYDKASKPTNTKPANPTVQDYIAGKLGNTSTSLFEVVLKNLPQSTAYRHYQFREYVDGIVSGCVKHMVKKMENYTSSASVFMNDKEQAQKLIEHYNGFKFDNGLIVEASLKC